MQPVKNGYTVHYISGGESYLKVACDLYRCPGCGANVATNFAHKPHEHFEPGYADIPTDVEVVV